MADEKHYARVASYFYYVWISDFEPRKREEGAGIREVNVVADALMEKLGLQYPTELYGDTGLPTHKGMKIPLEWVPGDDEVNFQSFEEDKEYDISNWCYTIGMLALTPACFGIPVFTQEKIVLKEDQMYYKYGGCFELCFSCNQKEEYAWLFI